MNSQTAIGQFVARLAFVVACLSSSLPATAQDAWEAHPYLTDKYMVKLGVFFPDRSFKIGVDASLPGIETNIDLSKQFKLGSNETTEALEFGWRFGKKWLVRGQAIINNNPPAVVERSVSTTGPLPNLGGWYLRSLSRRWALFARLDWLSADIDKYDGTIINASVGANFAITRHIGVGFAYNHFELDVSVKDTYWKGHAESRINGPYVHLSASW